MQTRQGFFLDLLSEPHVQYIIPVYQRLYSWTQKQCKTLWTDIMRAASYNRKHFLSTLLFIREGEEECRCEIRSIIDGQQRSATVTLLLAALAKYLDETHNELDGIDANTIRRSYLHCDEGVDGELRLILSRTDTETLFAIVNGTPLPNNASENVVRNFEFFSAKMQEEGFDAEKLFNGLKLLTVIFAELTNEDSPQLVFESLNSKGMPLSTADLIRNFLLIAMTHEEQTRLYDEYWAPIESMFQPDPGSLKLNNAVHGWLQVRYTKVRALKANEVYGVFKAYVEDEFDGTAEELLDELRSFCLVWAENYKYHAVKAFRSKFDWAKNGKPKTLVSDRPLKDGGPKTPPSYRDIDVYL